MTIASSRRLFTVRELAALLVLTVLPVLATAFLRAVLREVAPQPQALEWIDTSLISFVLYATCSWAALAGVVGIAGRARLRAHGLEIVCDRWRIATAVAAVFVGVGIYSGVEIVLAAMGMAGVAGVEYGRPSFVEGVLLFVAAVVSAAFCEEVFFRVIWIGVLGTWVPRVVAAAAGILVFALIHYPYFGVGGVIFVSVWALLPTALFLKFGDLTAPLLLHILNNTFAYLIVPLWLR